MEPILLRKDTKNISVLTLNSPKNLNALSESMLDALKEAFLKIGKLKKVKVVILRANGNAFCAGHDLKEMIVNRNETYYQTLFKKCSKMMMTLNQMPQPIIARIHGIATAAGCQLVAACDLAVAADEARFATSGINVGLFCSTPSVPVSRNIPRKQAMELLLTGEFIDSKTALSWGLINRTSPLEKLDEEINKLADSILAKSPTAVSIGKKMFYKQIELNMKDAYAFAGDVMACNMMSEDVAKGIESFMN